MEYAIVFWLVLIYLKADKILDVLESIRDILNEDGAEE